MSYESYTNEGEKVIYCKACDVVSSFKIPALFKCLGYSAPEDGENGVAIGYTVNVEAIKEFEQATNKTINYGVFAVLKDTIGNNPIFEQDGTPSRGVITAEITSYEFSTFELKMVGIKDDQKDIKFAMGAYVETKNGDEAEYFFLQAGDISENEKYNFFTQ